MKISICDVCHEKENKIVEAVCRSGFKGNPKFDFCKKHENYIRENKLESYFKVLHSIYGDNK